MNDIPSSNEPVKPSEAATPASAEVSTAASATPAKTTPDRGKRGAPASQNVVYFLLLILAIGLAALWWTMQSELSSLRQDIGRRLQTGENLATESRALAESAQAQMKDTQAKLAILENKQMEAQGQWVALEQLYQDLSKTRDDWILAEMEQVISTASQQLQLAGNVRGAIIALQNADARLAQYDNAQFTMIRRAVAKDLEVLQSLPSVDLTGIALRLDSAIGRVDSMPLLSDEKPPVSATEPKNQRFVASAPNADGSAAEGKRINDWLARTEQAWHSFTNELWMEMKQIVQVRKVDTPDALLLSPTDAYFARENLKLRLLNARLGLLARNESAFRSDLMAAQEAIVKYFDTRAKQTQTVQELLKQIQGSNLLIEMPTLTDSLNAIRSHKAKQ